MHSVRNHIHKSLITSLGEHREHIIIKHGRRRRFSLDPRVLSLRFLIALAHCAFSPERERESHTLAHKLHVLRSLTRVTCSLRAHTQISIISEESALSSLSLLCIFIIITKVLRPM